MENAILIQELTKSFRLGVANPRFYGLRHALTNALRNRFARKPVAPAAEFKALNGINLEIPRGTRLGLIGRNGSGKSTLLKVLSRILAPTAGRIELHGRVSSLLEVGTGFHPDLTGRENIFLNGAILGMRRDEIARKLDAIVEFSEVERFLDTPVKHYSSGMYVRLAFAVASQLDSEILFVDEVLAVGDIAFQKKCMGRMQQAASEGRTVLFVSHNLTAIQAFCSHVAVLDQGRLSCYADTATGVAHYMKSLGLAGQTKWERGGVPARSEFAIRSIACELKGAQPELEMELALKVDAAAVRETIAYRIHFSNQLGDIIFNAQGDLNVAGGTGMQEFQISVRLPAMIPGGYAVESVWIGVPQQQTFDEAACAIPFEIVAAPYPEHRLNHDSKNGCLIAESTARSLSLHESQRVYSHI